MKKILCMWLREVCLCSSLTDLLGSCLVIYPHLWTGILRQIRTKLPDLANRPVRACCYSRQHCVWLTQRSTKHCTTCHLWTSWPPMSICSGPAHAVSVCVTVKGMGDDVTAICGFNSYLFLSSRQPTKNEPHLLSFLAANPTLLSSSS